MPNGGSSRFTTRRAELDAITQRSMPERPRAPTPSSDDRHGKRNAARGRRSAFSSRSSRPSRSARAPAWLEMVYGFIKQSGGTSVPIAEVGRGTTFKLYLPLQSRGRPPIRSSGIARSRRRQTPRRGKSSWRSTTRAVRAAVVMQLKRSVTRYREAESAQARVADHCSPAGSISLFTDVVMPGGMNGKELARQARLSRRKLKILFPRAFPGHRWRTAWNSTTTTCC